MGCLLVTGGAGFIGCNFVRYTLRQTDDSVVVLDKLTYAGSMHNLADVEDHPRFAFVRGDIADPQCLRKTFRKYRPTAVINFAAESHVDRSIDSPRPFVDTNVTGTLELLDATRRFLSADGAAEADAFRFLHVSTDEVFGSLGAEGKFSETSPYAPNSPYAASKAAADHLVRAYAATFGLPVLITNCSNNYGPYQFPEKLIPLMILNGLEGRKLPIYGDGRNVRDWLYVEDHCIGIDLVLRHGALGESYNIGGHGERANLDVVDRLCELLERHAPATHNQALARGGADRYTDLKHFVEDRKGHDRRYAIDPKKIERELGWKPRHDFESGLDATVRWYLEHRDWCRRVQDDARYARERLGVQA